jgi:hypothetical protein
MRFGGVNLVLLLSAVLVALFAATSFGLIDGATVPVSDFKAMVERDEVRDVTFEGDVVTATVVAPEGADAPDGAAPHAPATDVRKVGARSPPFPLRRIYRSERTV